MRLTIECQVCKTQKIVNGQKQIDTFREEHIHGMGILACNHLEINNSETRILMGLDPRPLITHR